MAISGPMSANGFQKVVLRLEGMIIKGFLEGSSGGSLDALLRNEAEGLPPLLRVRPVGDQGVREIPIESTKAVFFVKDFDGDPDHKDLRFYRGAPIMQGVWIRVEFADGEVMEGLVQNAVNFLVKPGFFMSPTDPNSNNQLVYVVKSRLKDFRVLGLRNI